MPEEVAAGWAVAESDVAAVVEVVAAEVCVGAGAVGVGLFFES